MSRIHRSCGYPTFPDDAGSINAIRRKALTWRRGKAVTMWKGVELMTREGIDLVTRESCDGAERR